MSLIVRKPGILTTFQDLGRTGGRCFGINPNGAMDPAASRIVNTLVGNEDDVAVIEMHFPGSEIEFDDDTYFAVGGGDFGAMLGEIAVRNWTTVSARKGDVLRFGKKISGERSYLAIAGGIKTDTWLGSSSTNLTAGVGGYGGRKLQAGDRIECSPMTGPAGLTAGTSVLPRYSKFPTVRVIAGPEFELLTAPAERSFLSQGFTLTKDCNRMGYRLDGKPLNLLHPFDMVSAAVTFGTVQLLPDGQLIVLMADHQTSGGYPRIANVIPTDLPLLAQCGPGNGVGFTLVSIEEAELSLMRFEKELKYLRMGCRLQTLNAHSRS
jgi:antagonist of KipI